MQIIFQTPRRQLGKGNIQVYLRASVDSPGGPWTGVGVGPTGCPGQGHSGRIGLGREGRARSGGDTEFWPAGQLGGGEARQSRVAGRTPTVRKREPPTARLKGANTELLPNPHAKGPTGSPGPLGPPLHGPWDLPRQPFLLGLGRRPSVIYQFGLNPN